MKRMNEKWRMLFLHRMFFLTLLSFCCAARGAESFHWDVKTNRISANFRDWPLERVLSDIAQATKWNVKIPEDSGVKISGTFKNLPPRLALKRMFGHLNYALFSSPKGGKARLQVFLPPKVFPEELPPKSALARRRNPFSRTGGRDNYPHVVKRFDKDGDGNLSKAERDAALDFIKSNNP